MRIALASVAAVAFLTIAVAIAGQNTKTTPAASTDVAPDIEQLATGPPGLSAESSTAPKTLEPGPTEGIERLAQAAKPKGVTLEEIAEQPGIKPPPAPDTIPPPAATTPPPEATGGTEPPQTHESLKPPPQSIDEQLEQQSQRLVQIAARAKKSVVRIRIRIEGEKPSFGAGVLIRSGAAPGRIFVVTNWHVVLLALKQTVNNAAGPFIHPEEIWNHKDTLGAISIYLEGKKEAMPPLRLWTPAGSYTDDRRDDIALMEVSGENIQPAELGDSNEAQVGQTILAIGHPSSQTWSVSRGIISRTDGNELQTDAATNPGNSGGPIVDLQGKVIGIHRSVFAAQVEGKRVRAEGMTCCLASNFVRDVVDRLLELEYREGKAEPLAAAPKTVEP